jgi:hypothetical protein
MTGRLPALLDCKAVMTELGITRAAAEKIMRQLDVIELTDAGLRKTYVKRADVHQLLDQHTVRRSA